MPVIADSDEPPAKCCKFCEESTHSVEEPVSWRLTLDQDLIDTLKGSFPNWFPNSPAATSSSISSTNLKITTTTTAASNSYKGQKVNRTSLDKNYQQNFLYENYKVMAEGKNCNSSLAASKSSILGDNMSDKTKNCYDSRQSSPKSIVDSSPLQPAMDKNKESLKVKLMLRRPITQLVEQGIMPPLKTSPAIHEQCKQLERAKTGDLLKAKIQQRPDRQELERRHILEHDESHVDPSLAEKQRMLKKARLADQLNSQISHRPGPLELIKKNILHTEKPIERIVKEGLVSFKATSEGLLNRPQQPNGYITFDEDSQSSESDTRSSPLRSDVLEVAAASAGIVTVALTIPTSGGAVVVTSAPVPQNKFHSAIISSSYAPPLPASITSNNIKTIETIQVKQDTSNLFAELCQSVAGSSPNPNFLPIAASPVSLGSSTSTLSPLSSVASPPQSLTPRPAQSPLLQNNQTQKTDAPGKEKNRKKNKVKPISKTRTIKFHEYKGPPNAQKNISIDSKEPEETSYQLMLEQQNCLLRFLEKLNKNQTILPSRNSCITLENIVHCNSNHPPPQPSPALSIGSSIPASPALSYGESSSELIKLERMKVSDLKQQLKKRNLPVTGPKSQLIERLKPFLPLDSSDYSGTESVYCGETCDMDATNSPRHSISSQSENDHMDIQSHDSPIYANISISNEDLLREQQRKIDELQRQLQKSQQELQQIKQTQQLVVVEPPPPPPPQISQKMVVKQQLEAKIQKQQANKQAQLLLKNRNAALAVPTHKEEKIINIPAQIAQTTKASNMGFVWNAEHQTFFLVGLQNRKMLNANQRASSMPSIVLPIQTNQLIEPMIQQTFPHLHLAIKSSSQPPPNQPKYEIATEIVANDKKLKHINTENLTDVLNILIKNGELPESALETVTPAIENNIKAKLMPTTTTTTIKIPTTTASANLISTENMIFDDDTNKLQPYHTQQTNLQEPNKNTFNNSEQIIENIEMTSPIQTNYHIDTENVEKTLDIILEQQSQRTQSSDDMASFDDLELLELMSQQLDMEINEDTCPNSFQLAENISQTKQNLNTRRDMNPSLQPSIIEIIQQQQQQQQHHHQQTRQEQQQQQQTHQNPQQQENFNNNSNFSSTHFDVSNSNNDFTSNAMEICDDFDSTFDFSNLSQDSNINTPPHPFSSALSTANIGNNSSSTHIDSNSLTFSAQGANPIINSTIVSDSYTEPMSINQDNLMDLFGIDDFKMTWGEVDFAV